MHAVPARHIPSTTVPPSSDPSEQQKGRGGTGETFVTVADSEQSPVAAPMVSLGGLPSTDYSRHHHPGGPVNILVNPLPSWTQPSSEQPSQPPQEGIFRHQDGGPALIELPPLYEETRGPGRVGSIAPSARSIREDRIESKTSSGRAPLQPGALG